MDEKVAAKPDQAAIASPRRAPTQQRSRERVERMLAAASSLIAEQGSDAMRMGEVAERAGVSIGSLYQFFPDKRAIVWALAERYTAESQACIASALKDVSDAEALKQAFSELVDIYYRLFLAEPVMRDIWSGTQADKALRELELADSRANAEFLVAVLKRLRPGADPIALETTAFLVWQMGEAAVRLAISVDREEGDRLVAAYKRMALRELLAE
ncbi:TetR/AcrR family transcriptional regulator [Mesorhizobium sp. M1C.F.Ca.ET.193.01.1.1]|uniref:TetR/AcrR family transcriptional regulator n=1 Tax=unclassified Mesorhizobium TaxID=325217 RepID=UPI000FD2407F|nr:MULTISPECIES: TetR/AcrR family transcriptional regulator [unclassified Mesorhizobium]TGT04560.1 TetR/AcrR family transcriptional regulator [bacterium M00.F.Ca.ET.177.01.1.1]TGQ57389.1 TetR/AcrR family transcriptional regulator [Mesorhizobium sp. M1C.F.Ca.ET.210.01.1.1]TGQ75846.1 TetR/AcrR family transcriptional regulator [Mesorhizobium sp. M1C.F.Ca.ET.212.01.1.1]TGR14229.1 TetR/AcrR family transcriptional regulator [Mesorhizobium sp. M1C.F.Ca.ET.204.01.1.1]TGR35391.1 TetR/AcrR family transc